MKWIRRVIIEDFQSHRLTELDLVEGFNVIVGPSDQGKTAILRAIRWVLYNDPKGSDFIRVGSTKAKVTLIMNDGTIICRERSSSRNRYTVAVPGEEEQIYEGFGHNVPDAVKEATGIQLLKIDEDHQVAINLGMQLDPAFLLDNNGAIKAKAIGRVNGVHILDYAHKTTSSELTSKQGEERRVQAEIGKIEEQLLPFENLDTWQVQLERMEMGLLKADSLDQRIERLKDRKNQKEELERKLQIAEKYLARLDVLDRADSTWQQAQELERKGERFKQLQSRLQDTRAALQTASLTIHRTESLKHASETITAAEAKHHLAQELTKFVVQKTALMKEKRHNEVLLNQTHHLSRAEQLLTMLEHIQGLESQLHTLKLKQKEYQSLDAKIDMALTKTAHLEAAEKHWVQAEENERKKEALKIYQKRSKEIKDQILLVNQANQRTIHLGEAEQKWRRVDNVFHLLADLRQFQHKLRQVRVEKEMLETDQIRIEQKLEDYAKQYYEQLKSMGRCPICLGEVEHHTVERIFAELGS